MTFLAFQATNVFNCDFLTGAFLQFPVVLSVVAIVVAIVCKLDLRLTVTVDTPTHRQWRMLL